MHYPDAPISALEQHEADHYARLTSVCAGMLGLTAEDLQRMDADNIRTGQITLKHELTSSFRDFDPLGRLLLEIKHNPFLKNT